MRYAPTSNLLGDLWETMSRYARIAWKERSLGGYVSGLGELLTTILDQTRTPLTREHYNRLTGLTHARDAVNHAIQEKTFTTAALVAPGKNVSLVVRALRERGIACQIAMPGQETRAERADVIVVGTLSPGPMLDAAAEARLRYPGKRIILPWIGAATMLSSSRIAA